MHGALAYGPQALRGVSAGKAGAGVQVSEAKRD